MRRFVTINDREYEVPEVNFDTICQLEESGIYLMNMDRNERKIATMIRALVAWVTGLDLKAASAEISEHIANGGNIMDITNEIIGAITDAGFFRQSRKDNVQEFQPNRSQRRQKNKNRNGNTRNTGHSQKS